MSLTLNRLKLEVKHLNKKSNSILIMSELEFIEMADDCKNRIAEKNKEINDLKLKVVESRKDLIYAYVLIKDIDMMLQEMVDDLDCIIPLEFCDLVGNARNKVSALITDMVSTDIGKIEDD